MKHLPILIIFALLISSLPASAVYTKEIVSSQYPAFIAQFGIGEALYKINNNGAISYKFEKSRINPAAISSYSPSTLVINKGSTATFDYKVTGCYCSDFDGFTAHTHIETLYNDITGAKIDGKSYVLNDGEVMTSSFNLGTFNTAGTYKYRIEESILFFDIPDPVPTGDIIYLTVTVNDVYPSPTTPQPTYTNPNPTYTTPTPTYTNPNPTYTTPNPTQTTPSPTSTVTVDCYSGYVWDSTYETCRPILDVIGSSGSTIYIISGLLLVAGLYLLKRKEIKW